MVKLIRDERETGMRTVFQILISFGILGVIVSCSIAPEIPVNRGELMRTGIYNRYIIVESPEEVLDHLNEHGEVIIEAKRNVPGKEYGVYVKVLAAPEGLEVHDYER